MCTLGPIARCHMYEGAVSRGCHWSARASWFNVIGEPPRRRRVLRVYRVAVAAVPWQSVKKQRSVTVAVSEFARLSSVISLSQNRSRLSLPRRRWENCTYWSRDYSCWRVSDLLFSNERSALSFWNTRASDILRALICSAGFVRAEDEAEENAGTVENDLGASREASRTGCYLICLNLRTKNWFVRCSVIFRRRH